MRLDAIKPRRLKKLRGFLLAAGRAIQLLEHEEQFNEEQFILAQYVEVEGVKQVDEARYGGACRGTIRLEDRGTMEKQWAEGKSTGML